VHNQRVSVLKREDCSLYILKNKRGTVKGYFGFYTHMHPVFGPLAGPEFVFDKSIQGKGLSTMAYKILLEDMVKAKVKFLSGHTSQIGVFKNAKSMGRVPVNFALRHSPGYFGKKYFNKFIN